MNPCPCGNYGSKTVPCRCSGTQISKYLSRLSGPFLDRVDIQIEMGPITYDEFSGGADEECSADVKARVNAARMLQNARYTNENIFCNTQLSATQIKKYCQMDMNAQQLLKKAYEAFGFSARAMSRAIKVARTIADLAGEIEISARHMAEAVQFRTLDRKYWGNKYE